MPWRPIKSAQNIYKNWCSWMVVDIARLFTFGQIGPVHLKDELSFWDELFRPQDKFSGQIFALRTKYFVLESEVFDTIVSVSKVRYFWLKVSYRYRIGIEILNLKSISISIGIEISDIKVSISVSVSPFPKASLKFCISAKFAPSGSLKFY